MKLLFSCLYGSGLYGTSTPESDRDEKHIILPDLTSLLLGHAPRNRVVKTNREANQRNSASDVDREYIPLHVFARDFLSGQTYALELAWAIEYNQAEQMVYDLRIVDFCRELRQRFFTPDMTAMVGMAKNQASIYSAKGDRLNTAVAALELYRAFNPRTCPQGHEDFERFARLVADQYPDTFRITEYDSNGQGRMAPCVVLLERTLPHSATFKHSVEVIEAVIRKYGARARKAAEMAADWKATMHAMRIVDEAVTLLRGLPLVYPVPDHYREYLLRIRRGEYEFERVMEEIQDNLTLLETLAAISDLPRRTPELDAAHERWLLGWLTRFYFTNGIY